ncbi:hypothetical protein GF377_04530 [candidate division GN15 bacterium]|nr:hypothetical protein [candidate division GN15 bacterium]
MQYNRVAPIIGTCDGTAKDARNVNSTFIPPNTHLEKRKETSYGAG